MGNFLFPERLIAPPKITYYPQKYIDYSKLPVTDEYPIVKCVTLKTLPYLARAFDDNKEHLIDIVKATEAKDSIFFVEDLEIDWPISCLPRRKSILSAR